MKTITYEEFLELKPCWLDDSEEEAAKLKEIGSRRERWSAIDILNLDDSEVPPEDKLWAVLHEELIDAPISHEFACRCAERALSKMENPDPRAMAAIAAKRAWMKGEITDKQLRAAYDAAYDAAHYAAHYAAYDAAHYAAYDAAHYAAFYAAHYAAYHAADDASHDVAHIFVRCAARNAAFHAARSAASDDAGIAAYAAERAWQIAELKKMLSEQN